MNVLTGVVWKHRRLMELADVEGKFYFKARVLNAWRMVPFVDVETVLSEFKAHGLPMVMDSTVTVPSGDGPDSFAVINEPRIEEGEYKELTVSIWQASLMLIRIARVFGVADPHRR